MPMHPRVSTTALRHAPRRWLAALLPLLALVIAGAMAAASASEALAAALQRQRCRDGASGRSMSLRGSRAPAGRPFEVTEIVPSVTTAIDCGHRRPTAQAPCLQACSTRQLGARPAHIAIAPHPVGGVSSPGLPAPSSRAPPIA